MAKSEQQKQKQRMKKRQKDKQRKKSAASVALHGQSFSEMSPRRKILQARRFPIYECLINPDWKEKGTANVVVSRQQPDGRMTFAVYLLDTFCLGVKNSLCNADFAITEYEEKLIDRFAKEAGVEKCSPELAHQIIYGAIDFAAKYGFHPDKDFKLAQYVLEPRDAIGPATDLEFGHDGKPLYIAGPYDNVDKIMAQLALTAGEGNFHYIAPLSSGAHIPEEDDWESDE